MSYNNKIEFILYIFFGVVIKNSMSWHLNWKDTDICTWCWNKWNVSTCHMLVLVSLNFEMLQHTIFPTKQAELKNVVICVQFLLTRDMPSKKIQKLKHSALSLSLVIIYWFWRDRWKEIDPLVYYSGRTLRPTQSRIPSKKCNKWWESTISDEREGVWIDQQMMRINNISDEREGFWINHMHYKWNEKQWNDLLKAINNEYFKYPMTSHFKWQKQIFGRLCLNCM